MTTKALTSATVEAVQHAARRAMHIPSLDGIRALSFGLVFLGHAGMNNVIPAGFGVTVFFFLSGYLITTLLRLEWANTQHVSLQKFYLRRALRILPPFYLVFLLAYAAYQLGVAPPPTEPASLLSVVLHYSNYYMVVHDHHGFLLGTGVYWSLAVEEHFYLVFPWLFLWLARNHVSAKNQALTLLGICAAVWAWRCVVVTGVGGGDLRTHVATDTRVDSLLFGCVLAVYENPALDRSQLSEKVWKRVLLPLGVFGLLVGFGVRSAWFRETVRYSLQGLSLIPLFVCAVRYPSWGPLRALNWRPIAFVGELSYSLYLIHLLVLGLLDLHFGQTHSKLLLAALGLGISLLSSWLIYLSVERPCARLRRALST